MKVIMSVLRLAVLIGLVVALQVALATPTADELINLRTTVMRLCNNNYSQCVDIFREHQSSIVTSGLPNSGSSYYYGDHIRYFNTISDNITQYTGDRYSNAADYRTAMQQSLSNFQEKLSPSPTIETLDAQYNALKRACEADLDACQQTYADNLAAIVVVGLPNADTDAKRKYSYNTVTKYFNKYRNVQTKSSGDEANSIELRNQRRAFADSLTVFSIKLHENTNTDDETAQLTNDPLAEANRLYDSLIADYPVETINAWQALADQTITACGGSTTQCVEHFDFKALMTANATLLSMIKQRPDHLITSCVGENDMTACRQSQDRELEVWRNVGNNLKDVKVSYQKAQLAIDSSNAAPAVEVAPPEATTADQSLSTTSVTGQPATTSPATTYPTGVSAASISSGGSEGGMTDVVTHPENEHVSTGGLLGIIVHNTVGEINGTIATTDTPAPATTSITTNPAPTVTAGEGHTATVPVPMTTPTEPTITEAPEPQPETTLVVVTPTAPNPPEVVEGTGDVTTTTQPESEPTTTDTGLLGRVGHALVTLVQLDPSPQPVDPVIPPEAPGPVGGPVVTVPTTDERPSTITTTGGSGVTAYTTESVPTQPTPEASLIEPPRQPTAVVTTTSNASGNTTTNTTDTNIDGNPAITIAENVERTNNPTNPGIGTVTGVNVTTVERENGTTGVAFTAAASSSNEAVTAVTVPESTEEPSTVPAGTGGSNVNTEGVVGGNRDAAATNNTTVALGTWNPAPPKPTATNNNGEGGNAGTLENINITATDQGNGNTGVTLTAGQGSNTGGSAVRVPAATENGGAKPTQPGGNDVNLTAARRTATATTTTTAAAPALPAMRRFDVHSCMPKAGNEGKWCGYLEPSYSFMSGNSQIQQLTFSGALTKRIEKWQYGVVGAINYVETNGDISDDSYWAGFRLKYHLGSAYSIFNEASYENTRSQGYDMILTNVTGLEREFKPLDAMTIRFGLGLGVRKSETTAGVERTDFLKQARAQLNWQLSQRVTLNEFAKLELGEHLTTWYSDTKLDTQLTDAMDLVYTLGLVHYSEVPASSRKLNMSLRAGLRYDFEM